MVASYLPGVLARQILGTSGQYDFRTALSVAFCGWRQRLGSKAIGREIVYLAEIQLLPTEHPTARMVLASVSTVGETWVSSVKELMSTFPVPIPYILESGLI